jgi:hypothetical protein
MAKWKHLACPAMAPDKQITKKTGLERSSLSGKTRPIGRNDKIRLNTLAEEGW